MEDKKDIDYSKMNVYKKLQIARKLFFEEGIKKSGMNNFHTFKYFELADIVPIATKIFDTVGLVTIYGFNEFKCWADVVNTDDPTQEIEFSFPIVKLEFIGKVPAGLGNTIQFQGATQTYLRRYLWNLILDVTENDAFDSNENAPQQTQTPQTNKAPATVQQRATVKANLVADEKADDLMIIALNKQLGLLKATNKENEEYVNKIYATSDNLQKITKPIALQILAKVRTMLEEVESGDKVEQQQHN